MKQFLAKGATLRSLVKTPSRGFYVRNFVQRRGGQTKAFLLASSMMLVGGTSYFLYNHMQSLSLADAVAEAESNQEQFKQRIARKIQPDCHLSLDPMKQTLLVMYDSSNALQKEFLSEVEAK
jgi:hypothetical protein